MICVCTWCYATWSSFAFDATLHVLHLHLMLRYMIFTCTWCYAVWSSLAFSQMRMGMGLGWGGVGIIWDNTKRAFYATWSSFALDATLHVLQLHSMLRYMIFTCTWCYAVWSSPAFSFASDARIAQPQALRSGWVETNQMPEWHDQKRSSFLFFTKRIFHT